MKLSVFATILALSTEAFAACAKPGQVCKRGDPDLCECNGKHVMRCESSIHIGNRRPKFTYHRLYHCYAPRKCTDGKCPLLPTTISKGLPTTTPKGKI
ncbi:uncharacterized protein FTOL_03921 [Fusarium torulosum]|uniref:Uncharacterized protein n=1 Tax=Fusarium torulosum TaxID=33205 RepID=A0AAE8SG28_9HYPO|nr:uncharacterized protein FTOL_03921 [Fusarium torulosum]